ncbi:MAG: hypothetical protein RJA22_1253 [Verrucomicrobiota bacterium]|jgi:ribosomal protein S11
MSPSKVIPTLGLALTLLAAPASLAGPLQKNRVPATAKWVLHIDLEAALRSQLGNLLARELVDRSLAKPLRDLKKTHDLEVDWRKIQAVTAFGNEVSSRPDEDGVLLLQGGVNVAALLDKVMEDLGSTGPLTRQGPAGRARYTLNEEFHAAEAPGGLFAISRSAARLDESLATLGGRGAHLGSNPRFAATPPAADGFIYLALSEGLGTLSDLPQAALLQQAMGGQLVAGERAGQAFAALQLSTRDAAAASQLHGVVQGLIALGQLNQANNPDLQRLLRNARVTTNQALVTLSLQAPATNVVSQLARELRLDRP